MSSGVKLHTQSSSMRTKSNQNKLMKIITVPIRVLKKGRDMYVESMMNYAQKPRYTTTSNNTKGSAKIGQAGVSGLPKSFSTTVTSTRSSLYDGNDDLRELIRANSTTHNNKNMNLDVESHVKQLIEEQKLSRQKLYNDHSVENNGVNNSKMAKGVPRSYSVGLGRIDEGKACEFDEEEEEVEDGVKKVNEVMLRSRSHAVGVGNRKSSLAF
ncbi:uncharacterized protein LOC141708435 [Apium graveolens]|uniref:uncharacterized protein LOC141708435 n=1 Tax=Apium graveolens TaxID=4045 RepID=UPI003D7C09B6